MSHFQWALQMILVLYNNDHFFFLFCHLHHLPYEWQICLFTHKPFPQLWTRYTHVGIKRHKNFHHSPKSMNGQKLQKKKRKKKRTRKRPKYFHLRFNHHYPLHFSAKSIKGIFVPMQKKATLSFRCLTLNPQKKLNIKIKRKKKFKAHEQAKSKIQRSRAVGAHVPTPYPCSEDKAFVNGTQNIFKDSITFWLKI